MRTIECQHMGSALSRIECHEDSLYFICDEDNDGKEQKHIKVVLKASSQ